MWNQLATFEKRGKQDQIRPLLQRIIDGESRQRILTIGQRLEERSNICRVALAVPLSANSPVIPEAFPVITKDFCSKGLALIVTKPFNYEKLLVGIHDESSLIFARGRVIHAQPLGGGFTQLGVELTEIVHPNDYPGLSTLTL